MNFRRIAVVLCILVTFGVAKDNITVGIFFNKDENGISYWDALEDILDGQLDIIPEIAVNDEYDVFDKDITEAKKRYCNFVSNTKSRIVATLGPRSPFVSPILESVSHHLGIPYFITSWRPKSEQLPNVFNVYPEADLLAKGLAKIIESFDWSEFVILFEDDQGLLRLQEILKIQQFEEGNLKNGLTLEKLNIGGDNRHIFKKIRSSSINKIILDCYVDRIMEYFNQADQVGLMSDFSRSFFLTSLDAHTLDFNSIQTQTNITTIRLFDPLTVDSLKMSYDLQDLQAPFLRVDDALTFDALALTIRAVNLLKSNGEQFEARELNCDAEDIYPDDIGLIDVLKQAEVRDSLTGLVSLPEGKRDKFTLQVIEVGGVKRKSTNPKIATWNAEFPEIIKLERNISEMQAELENRMKNHRFIVTSRLGPPYLFENKEKDAHKNRRYYGYSMDLITEIANLVNITFEFQLTKDNSFLNLVNDLVERRAELGICDFTITPQRSELIDFSLPFMNLGIGILHKQSTQEEVDNMYAFMRPISWTVWFYIWTLSLATSVTMFIVARLSPSEWENPKPWDPESKELENIWNVKNFLWFSVGAITAQGCDILPKSVAPRIISASWWFFSLIIMSSYIANLAAFLTMQKRDVTIDSVEELAAQSRVKYGLMSKGSTEMFFSTSNNSLYQKMWNTMKNEKSVFETDNPSGVERVLSTKNELYAYFMESTGIEYEMGRQCDLRKIGGQLDSKSYGIGMPLNADYRHTINSAILRLQESGKLMELKQKWWEKEREGEPCNRISEEQSDALALSNVGGIFIVLAVGLALAYIIAIIEFLWNVRKLSIEEHLSFMETLKCELKFACKIYTRKKRAKPVPSESSSSTKSFNREKMSAARDLFNKSASLLDFHTDNVYIRNRVKSPSGTEGSAVSRRVNGDSSQLVHT